MTNNNYMDTINEAKKLLTELLNDTDHGKLTFKGLRGLDDLTITSPQQLDAIVGGSVLAIGMHEWMALDSSIGEQRHWQKFRSNWRVTSEQLYLIALKTSCNLTYCHAGF